MADYYRELVALLRTNGFRFLRSAKGSHEIWVNPETNQQVTVPRSTKSRHTAKEVLKQARLPKKF